MSLSNRVEYEVLNKIKRIETDGPKPHSKPTVSVDDQTAKFVEIC